MQTQLRGGILTGGLARRLQSISCDEIDKGLLTLHGKTLVAHAAHKLSPYTQRPLLISANRNRKEYEKYGEVVADPNYLASYQGPLAGILAMLSRLTTDWLIVLPVDSPFLPINLVPELWHAHIAQPEKRVFFVQHDRTYPLCLLIHKECGAALRAYLLSGQRRVQSWLAEQDAVAVDVRHYPVDSFFNINEPTDLQRAQALKNPSV